MYKVDQKPYDPRYVGQFVISLEEHMNQRAADGWVLMSTPMVSEKLAFALMFWHKADEYDEKIKEDKVDRGTSSSKSVSTQ